MADDTAPRGPDLGRPAARAAMPIPTVLCPEDKPTANRTFSECQFSLPSSCGTPTSPFILSSPLSLPTSPTPFVKSEGISGSAAAGVAGAGGAAAPKLTVETGSNTGNPRNKCALAPGHSLMDWIRLGNSGRDLTGVGGRLRAVSPQELATHASRNDAWLAIRGRVYNVTHYIPFHPGGEEELMRGAGTDATKLFDGVHPWVNYDSLLAKCLVGPLRHERPDAEELFGAGAKPDRLPTPSKAQELVRKSMENLANCITPVRRKINAKSEENVKNPSRIMQSLIHSSDLPLTISRAGAPAADAPPPLKSDWIQTSAKLTVSVYTGPLANPGACARLSDGALLLEVVTNSWLRTLKVVPETKLCEPLVLKVYAESGKIELTAQKQEPCLWKGCAISSSGAAAAAAGRALACRVSATAPVSHDTTLLTLAVDAGPVLIPLGHHVRVHCEVDGAAVSRSYTPVQDGCGPAGGGAGTGTVRLAVKRYAAGACSRHLAGRRVGDTVALSGPYGDFELMKLKGVRRLTLVAAGTGVTPMLGLLRFMLARCNPRSERLDLLFFNKKEEDILFREYFDELAKTDRRFTATHVLSDAPEWAGAKGRITRELLAAALGAGADGERFLCVCGPAEFTSAALRLLAELGVRDQCVHAFTG